jgi:hypothetical protein
MMSNLSETLKLDFEALPASTVAGTTSGMYDMRDYDHAFIGVALGLKAASIATISTVWVDLMETSAVSAAPTSAAGGKTGIELGAPGNTSLPSTAGIKAVLMVADTGATTGELFHMGVGTNIVTLTFSSLTSYTSAGTWWTATAAYFGAGSAVETTADTGETGVLDSIRRVLQSTRLCIGGPHVWNFTTPSTDSMTIELVNPPDKIIKSASTAGPLCMYFNNTMSTETVVARAGVVCGGFNIRADQMTSTASKRFIGVKLTSAAQAVGLGITVIRSKGRYMPQGFIGKLST